MGASKGVIRRLPLDPSVVMDYIPVDVVVNQILVTGEHVNSLMFVFCLLSNFFSIIQL